MKPQEIGILAALPNRPKRAPAPEIDREAVSMIGQAVAARQDLPYLLAQTVLVQDLALTRAQDRVTAAEHSRSRSEGHESGLGDLLAWLFGRSSDHRGALTLPPVSTASSSFSDTSLSGSSTFLHTAAATAGVAGGALLTQGIQSILGPAVAANLPRLPNLSQAAQVEPAVDRQDAGYAAAKDDTGFSDKEFF